MRKCNTLTKFSLSTSVLCNFIPAIGIVITKVSLWSYRITWESSSENQNHLRFVVVLRSSFGPPFLLFFQMRTSWAHLCLALIDLSMHLFLPTLILISALGGGLRSGMACWALWLSPCYRGYCGRGRSTSLSLSTNSCKRPWGIKDSTFSLKSRQLSIQCPPHLWYC